VSAPASSAPISPDPNSHSLVHFVPALVVGSAVSRGSQMDALSVVFIRPAVAELRATSMRSRRHLDKTTSVDGQRHLFPVLVVWARGGRGKHVASRASPPPPYPCWHLGGCIRAGGFVADVRAVSGLRAHPGCPGARRRGRPGSLPHRPTGIAIWAVWVYVPVSSAASYLCRMGAALDGAPSFATQSFAGSRVSFGVATWPLHRLCTRCAGCRARLPARSASRVPACRCHDSTAVPENGRLPPLPTLTSELARYGICTRAFITTWLRLTFAPAGLPRPHAHSDTVREKMKLAAQVLAQHHAVDLAVELLCAIRRFADAAGLLWNVARYEDAVALARTTLPAIECTALLQRWATMLRGALARPVCVRAIACAHIVAMGNTGEHVLGPALFVPIIFCFFAGGGVVAVARTRPSIQRPVSVVQDGCVFELCAVSPER